MAVLISFASIDNRSIHGVAADVCAETLPLSEFERLTAPVFCATKMLSQHKYNTCRDCGVRA